MTELSIGKPVWNDFGKYWTAYIIKDGLLTGVVGEGDTSQKATGDAQAKIKRGEGELMEDNITHTYEERDGKWCLKVVK